ncbi:MAG TPA: ATP-binding protein [Jiangellaceae bacterium]|nr:ATP-binding protein [Jiangellaceae bacterium]
MATVELRFAARPAHVRTARQVAVTLARRAKLAEPVLDAVRLAVGEACGLVVALQRETRPNDPVVVTFDDSRGLAIDVHGVVALEPAEGVRAVDILAAAAEPVVDELPVGASLAVVSELVPRLDVITSLDGVTVTMRWPAEASAHA